MYFTDWPINNLFIHICQHVFSRVIPAPHISSILYRLAAPGWWQQLTAYLKTKISLTWNRFQFFLDCTTEARSLSQTGALVLYIYDKYQWISHRRKVKVEEILVHQDYSASGSKENDIALLRLGQSFVNLFFLQIFNSRLLWSSWMYDSKCLIITFQWNPILKDYKRNTK